MASFGAESIRSQGEEILPAAHVFNHEKKGVEMYAFMDFGPESKPQISRMIDSWLKRGFDVVTINEAWVSVGHTKSELFNQQGKLRIAPSEDPDRIEVCLIQLFVPSGHRIGWRREIVGDHFHGEWQLMEPMFGTKFGGPEGVMAAPHESSQPPMAGGSRGGH